MNETSAETAKPQTDVAAIVAELGQRAKAAARDLAMATAEQRNAALTGAAKALRAHAADIMAANAQDLDSIKGSDKDAAFIDRLTLTEARIADMADAVDAIAAQNDPLGRVLATFERPNGLKIERVSVPIGVIGMIYESRPNVGSDAGALCVKSGNAVILRIREPGFLARDRCLSGGRFAQCRLVRGYSSAGRHARPGGRQAAAARH